MNKFYTKITLYFLAITSSAIFFFNIAFTLTSFPPSTADDAIFANLAFNIINKDCACIDLFEGYGYGMEERAAWYPTPIYGYILAGWKYLLGNSLVAQRLIQTTASIGVIYFIIRLFTFVIPDKKNVGLLAIILASQLANDTFFSYSSKMSRPEMLVLFIGVCSVYMHFLSEFTTSTTIKKYTYVVLSGIFSSLAILMHPIGVQFSIVMCLFYLARYRFEIFKQKVVFVYALSLGLPILIGIFHNIQYWEHYVQQFQLASERKYLDPPFLIRTLSTNPLVLNIIFYVYLFIGGFLSLLNLANKKIELKYLGIITIISILFGLMGRGRSYFLYIIPWILMSTLLFSHSTKKTLLRDFVIILTCGHLMFSGGYKIWEVYVASVLDHDYEAYVEELVKIIPDDKLVYISARPDPYVGFVNNERSNKFRLYPPLRTTKEMYKTTLDNADYIVHNGSYSERYFVGDYLERYLSLNSLNKYHINQFESYNVYVIELVSKVNRRDPEKI